MPKERRLFGDAITWKIFALFPNVFHHFDDIIEMTLGINPSGKRQPNQFKGGRGFHPGFGVGFPKHDASQFDGPHSTFQKNFIDQGNPRILKGLKVWEKLPGIQINGVAPLR